MVNFISSTTTVFPLGGGTPAINYTDVWLPAYAQLIFCDNYFRKNNIITLYNWTQETLTLTMLMRLSLFNYYEMKPLNLAIGSDVNMMYRLSGSDDDRTEGIVTTTLLDGIIDPSCFIFGNITILTEKSNTYSITTDVLPNIKTVLNHNLNRDIDYVTYQEIMDDGKISFIKTMPFQNVDKNNIVIYSDRYLNTATIKLY